MLRAGFLLLFIGMTVFWFYFFGAGPSASEWFEDLQWWRPWGTAMRHKALEPLADLARAGFPSASIPLLLWCLPPVALFAIGHRIFRSAVARAFMAFMTACMLFIVYYGSLFEQAWRFFEWRFPLVGVSFCAVVALALYAPSLLRSASHVSRLLAASALAVAFAVVLVLSTEITGTNPEISFNLSPWPLVTLVGFLLVAYTLGALHAAAGLGVWITHRFEMSPGLTRVLACGALGAVVGFAGGAMVFTGTAGTLAVALVGVLYACVALWRSDDDSTVAQSAALTRAVSGVAILAMITVSTYFASSLQRTARDETALEVLLALEAYKREQKTYPDDLEALVPDYLAEIPRPRIGLILDEDDAFTYTGFGDSYALEFSSVLWVQCAYNPPFEFAAYDEEDEEEEEYEAAEGNEDLEAWETPDVAAAAPTADQLAAQALLARNGLDGAWSCAEEPPKLW